MEPAPQLRKGGELRALASCHQLPAFVLSPFTAPVSLEAATISPVHGAGIVVSAGWSRGSQPRAVEERGAPGNQGCNPQTVTKIDFPCMACVLHCVVLNNSHEEAPHTPLETSGFPGRSCSWETSLPNYSFMGMCHCCPHSQFNMPAVTPRSRYFYESISMAQGVLRAHHRKAELCQLPQGWCPPALRGCSSSTTSHRDALESEPETSPQLQKTVLLIPIPHHPSFPALHTPSAACASWPCWAWALRHPPVLPPALFSRCDSRSLETPLTPAGAPARCSLCSGPCPWGLARHE